MSGKKWKEVELMYIEGGTFEGGEEEVFDQGFKREEEYLFIEKAALDEKDAQIKELVEVLKKWNNLQFGFKTQAECQAQELFIDRDVLSEVEDITDDILLKHSKGASDDV